MLFRRDNSMDKRVKDITGQKFGRLKVIKFDGIKNSNAYFLCKCDCGTIKSILGKNIRKGHTKACGCLNKTINIKYRRFYNIYCGIKGRCNTKSNTKYYMYGGRGIKNLWKSFEEFKDDMYESYLEHIKEFGEKETTIDRTNNNGNYEKNNCRWRTGKEQCNNTRRNRLLTFNKQTITLTQWARKLNIKRSTLSNRINTLKWSINII